MDDDNESRGGMTFPFFSFRTININPTTFLIHLRNRMLFDVVTYICDNENQMTTSHHQQMNRREINEKEEKKKSSKKRNLFNENIKFN